jgi:hypothetical protein
MRIRTVARLLLAMMAVAPCVLGAQRPGHAARPRPKPSTQVPARPLSERETLMRFCLQTDSTAPQTVDGVRQRTDCWKRMQLQGMGDSLVDARFQAALDDYADAARADSSRTVTDSSASAMSAKIAAIQRALVESRIDDADRLVNEVLAIQPQNQRALAFHDRVVALKRTRQLRIILFSVAGAVLLLGAGLGIFARVLAKRHEHAAAARLALEAQRRAMVEIIDGVGRGKLYAIEGPIFRIGSAMSDRPEERNDLVLSDESAFISRYHCSIIRKDGRYFLIDSSLNGTYVGDELMERGEHRALEDGAEFSIAGMARFKFLLI